MTRGISFFNCLYCNGQGYFIETCIFVRPHTLLEETEQIDWSQVKSGDKTVFETLFKRFYPVLCRYAKSMLHDLDEAEEVVQNTFYILWKKRESIQIQSSLKSYLYRAVHNDCLNKLKHQKVRQVHAEDYKHTAGNAYEDSGKLLQAKELKRKIDQALEALPEQCGRVFRLNRFEELKYKEIAEHLNISIKTVEIHMSKALKHMREHLKEYLPVLIWMLTFFKWT